MIYLIKKLWADPLENHDQYGYTAVGYVTTEEEAKAIVEKGGVRTEYPANNFLVGDLPHYQYMAIEPFREER
jgi:hypothetical protein